MTKALGDFDTATVVYGKFTTYRPSTGASYTLAGTPSLSVYKDNSTTQTTTGVTLTVDFDSVTGLNHFAIDTSADGSFYAAGSFFDVVITAGTVDGVSVVGSVVGSFTLRKNSALKPTTAGRTVAVDASGNASANLIQVSGAAVSASTAQIGVNVVNAGGTAWGSGSITAGSIAASALNGKGDWNIGKTGYSLSPAGVQAIWDSLTSALTTIGSVGKLLVDNVNATISSRLASASYTAPPTAVQNADALLDRDMSVGTDSGGRTVRNALRPLRNKIDVSAGQVYKEDDSTVAWSFSTTTNASAVPITSIDPS